jgi:hypothetical protein
VLNVTKLVVVEGVMVVVETIDVDVETTDVDAETVVELLELEIVDKVDNDPQAFGSAGLHVLSPSPGRIVHQVPVQPQCQSPPKLE